MKAQAYYDYPMIVRIFNRFGKNIADLPLDGPTDEDADNALKQMRLRRRTKWTVASWGREAEVRFVTKK